VPDDGALLQLCAETAQAGVKPRKVLEVEQFAVGSVHQDHTAPLPRNLAFS
jgi:hypothetical protein